MHEKRYSGGVERLRSPERIKRLDVERVVQLCLEGDKFSCMLDVGTGSGLFGERFAKQGVKVTGIDSYFEMLPVSRSYVANGNFVQAIAEALPFLSKSFDLAFYGLVLHEADDPLAVLHAARRVSRKRVCLLEWPYTEQTFGPPLDDRLNPDMLEKMFRQAGYKNWKCEHLENVDLYRLSV